MQFSVVEHILVEDDYILVINKPAGLMVEPDRNGHPNLLNYVKQYLKSKSGSAEPIYAQHIHRLDRPVSGIILFAKQKAVLKNLSEQFAERKVKKTYQAITISAPEKREGKLECWMRKEKKKALPVDESALGAVFASLSYTCKEEKGNQFLWDIDLHTGKFHQIRMQLSQLGCPINGDKLYGSEVDYRPDSIALHAYKLMFFHPITNEEIIIEQKKNW